MAESTTVPTTPATKPEHQFVRAIGLFDGTMIVVGSMIGSGIFIVAADISRQTGSAGGLLLTWILTGLLTIAAALSYGELAALFPHAGGQYVYLREAFSPLWGFLYGWTLFLVIQTGTIAAVAIGFARYLGVLFPSISPNTWIIPPLNFSSKFAISLSVQQLVAVVMILFLTFLNTRGVRLGKWIQNIFTSAKMLSLLGLILLCVFVARNATAIADNFSHLWAIRGANTITPGVGFLARHFAYGDGGERLVRLAAGACCRASRLVIFRRRLEQHRIHGGGSKKSEARRGAVDGLWDHHCYFAVLPRQPGLFVRAAFEPDSERAGRPCGHRGAFRDLWSQRRGDHGCGDYYFHLRLQQWLDSGGLARCLCHGQRRLVFQGHRKIKRSRRAGCRAGLSRRVDCGFDFAAHAQARRDLREFVQQSSGLRGVRGAAVLRFDHRGNFRAAHPAGPMRSARTRHLGIRWCRCCI